MKLGTFVSVIPSVLPERHWNKVGIVTASRWRDDEYLYDVLVNGELVVLAPEEALTPVMLGNCWNVQELITSLSSSAG